jgi:hypothetical protein
MTTNDVGTPVRKLKNGNDALTRVTLAHMLWEDQFYVDGKTSANVMADLVAKADPAYVAILAEKARSEFKLRHVPLYLTRELARAGKLKAATLANVIQRPDEMSEFLSIYWKDGKVPISNQVKKGLAKAFTKFNEYQLAKHDKNSSAISLRDVMFLSHAKPANATQAELFKRVANQELKTPDTWETQLSAGANKKDTFERLMAEKSLGALAFLRNLRNMLQAGISESVIREYSKNLDVSRVLPFRYIAAARIVPQFEDMLEAMMLRSLANHEKLPGRTVLVVDTSGSMAQRISGKSDLSRIDAACALAILAREICEEVVIYATAGEDYRRTHATMQIPPRRGFALSEYITSHEVQRNIGGGGIFLVQAMDYIAKQESTNKVDRVIVFTDEQDTGGRGFEPHKAKRLADGKNYIMNVGASQNGINSTEWLTITGFSEAAIDYLQMAEKLSN